MILAVFLIIPALASAVPFSEYILAPFSRTLYPQSIHSTSGNVTGAKHLLGLPNGGLTTFHGQSSITFDFQQTIEGIVSLDISHCAKTQNVSISFTESSMYIFSDASDSTDNGLDVPLFFKGNGAFTADPRYRRGAFRYLTVATHGAGVVKLSSLSVYFTAYPQAAENALRDYTGYFHSNDEELNLVWYAGAWTCQLCVIDPGAGDAVVHPNSNPVGTADGYDLYQWYNNITISDGTSVLVDGAKRDRLVWPGDYVVSIASSAVSFGDLEPVRNGLDSLFILQSPSGMFPYTGTPIWENLFDPAGVWSYTYHTHTLSDLYTYYMFTRDTIYLQDSWAQAVLGLNYSISFIGDNGLVQVPDGNADWGRGGVAGYNIEANGILYRAINQYIELATIIGQTRYISQWNQSAAGIKSAANALLWNDTVGLYNDNPDSTLNPQDGNVFAIISGLADPERAAIISQNLAARWTPYGPPAPEAGATISPFITSLELEAHFMVQKPQLSIDLMKSMFYKFMMNDPRMTNSTFIEGYSTDGELVYAYSDNPRLSFTHGWSTGPTSVLSRYVVGIQFISAGGKTWLLAPQVGDLTSVEGGYASPLGMFEAKYTAIGNNSFLYEFSTPEGTKGSVSVAKPVGCMKKGTAVLKKNSGAFAMASAAGWDVAAKSVPANSTQVLYSGVKGGVYALQFTC